MKRMFFQQWRNEYGQLEIHIIEVSLIVIHPRNLRAKIEEYGKRCFPDLTQTAFAEMGENKAENLINKQYNPLTQTFSSKEYYKYVDAQKFSMNDEMVIKMYDFLKSGQKTIGEKTQEMFASCGLATNL